MTSYIEMIKSIIFSKIILIKQFQITKNQIPQQWDFDFFKWFDRELNLPPLTKSCQTNEGCVSLYKRIFSKWTLLTNFFTNMDI